MSKSVGQWIGTAVGAVAGFFLPGGYVALGASIGGMVGGMIDPPKGPSVTGPRLEDQGFTSSTLGAALARGYGTFPVSGNVIWLEGDKYREVTTTESQGGKGGGGGSEVTSYTYYATFAVSLLRVTDPTQTVSLRRLWIGSNLVFDAGSGNLESVIASNTGEGVNFTFYNGTDTQQPNPRWQADKGVNAVSGMPGRCYIVIEDLDLTKYGNSLAMAQIKAEVVVGAAVAVSCHQAETVIGGITGDRHVTSCVFVPSGAEYTQVDSDGWTTLPENIDYCSLRLSDYHRISSSLDITADIGSFSTYAIYQVPAVASDRPVTILQLVPPSPFNNESRIWLYSPNGDWQSLAIPGATLDVAAHKFASVEGSETFIHQAPSAGNVHRFAGSAIAATSAGTYAARASGLSENYLFLVGYTLSGTTTTIYRLNRSDLSLNATWTGTALPYNASIHVIDDETVYTAAGNGGSAGGHVYKWVSGTVVEDLGQVVPATFSSDTTTLSGWFRVVNDAPPYVLSLSNYAGLNDAVWIGHATIPASAASLREVVTAECRLAGIASADLDLTALIDEPVRGYRITERGSVRAALEPLQARFPFDVAHSGYKLRFVSRGGPSLATTPESDLGTVSGGEKDAVLLTVAREMDTQLPRKVSVKYLDVDREYDMGEQYAERPAPNSVNERVLELPLVMNSNEGAQTADILLSKEWVERVDFGPFSLPPAWRHLEAADVVTVEHRGQAHTIRLTRVEYLPDGRITCNAKLSAAQSYTSTATGEAPAVLGQSLVPLRGSTSAYLLDIPRIRAEQDVPGMAFGLLGRASGWPGGVLLRSDDSGNTWTSVGAMNSSARVFIASNTLSAHHGYSIDHAAVLTVTPETPGAELFSVTEEQFYSQANLAVYGADGRWEVVAFMLSTDNAGTFTLKNFLRGLYGSEWATGLHAAGDLLVMLDTATVGFFGLPTNAIGSARLYRAVTQGSTIDSASSVIDNYEAHNLKPLAPVDGYGVIDRTSGDWLVGVQRRSRWPVEVFSGAVVPVGESVEAYVFEIWNSTYTALKRSVNSFSPYFTYSAYEQVADFGGVTTTVYVRCRMTSSVVGGGGVIQFSLTRYFADDTYVAALVFLSHLNGPGFVDEKGKSITAVGGAAISTSRFKFGAASLLLSGSGQYCSMASSADWNFGTGDFTVESWVYIAANSAAAADGNRTAVIFSINDSASTIALEFTLLGNASTTGTGLGIYSGSNGVKTATVSVSQSAWHHVAVCRSGTSLRFFLDGTQAGTTITDSGSWGSSSLSAYIGGRPFGSNYYYYLNGNIDDVRITKAARYTSNFTPPAAEFPNP